MQAVTSVIHCHQWIQQQQQSAPILPKTSLAVCAYESVLSVHLPTQHPSPNKALSVILSLALFFLTVCLCTKKSMWQVFHGIDITNRAMKWHLVRIYLQFKLGGGVRHFSINSNAVCWVHCGVKPTFKC